MTDLTDRAATPVPAHVRVAAQMVAETAAMMAVAAWLEDHGHNLPAPRLTSRYADSGYVRCVSFWAPDRETFAVAVRVMARGAHKGAVPKKPGADGSYMDASRMFGSVLVEVLTARENVCVRRQVGVETVEVPHPSVDVPDVAMVTVERPVYEWECEPTLTPPAADTSEVY